MMNKKITNSPTWNILALWYTRRAYTAWNAKNLSLWPFLSLQQALLFQQLSKNTSWKKQHWSFAAFSGEDVRYISLKIARGLIVGSEGPVLWLFGLLIANGTFFLSRLLLVWTSFWGMSYGTRAKFWSELSCFCCWQCRPLVLQQP